MKDSASFDFEAIQTIIRDGIKHNDDIFLNSILDFRWDHSNQDTIKHRIGFLYFQNTLKFALEVFKYRPEKTTFTSTCLSALRKNGLALLLDISNYCEKSTISATDVYNVPQFPDSLIPIIPLLENDLGPAAFQAYFDKRKTQIHQDIKSLCLSNKLFPIESLEKKITRAEELFQEVKTLRGDTDAVRFLKKDSIPLKIRLSILRMASNIQLSRNEEIHFLKNSNSLYFCMFSPKEMSFHRIISFATISGNGRGTDLKQYEQDQFELLLATLGSNDSNFETSKIYLDFVKKYALPNILSIRELLKYPSKSHREKVYILSHFCSEQNETKQDKIFGTLEFYIRALCNYTHNLFSIDVPSEKRIEIERDAITFFSTLAETDPLDLTEKNSFFEKTKEIYNTNIMQKIVETTFRSEYFRSNWSFAFGIPFQYKSRPDLIEILQKVNTPEKLLPYLEDESLPIRNKMEILWAYYQAFESFGGYAIKVPNLAPPFFILGKYDKIPKFIRSELEGPYDHDDELGELWIPVEQAAIPILIDYIKNPESDYKQHPKYEAFDKIRHEVILKYRPSFYFFDYSGR